MAWYDFLFGKGPLAKAAQQGDPTPPVNNQDAGIDVAGIAQQQADAIKKAKKKKKPGTLSDLMDDNSQ